MKRNVIAWITAAAMAAGSLAGCSGSSTGSPSSGTQAAAGTGSAQISSEAGGSDTPSSSEEVTAEGQTITFWHSMGGVNGEAIDYLVSKFNAENSLGIKVEAQYQGSYDDAINKLRSAQIGNMGADLVQIYDIGTRFMIDSGWVIPMQELIDRDGWDISQVEPNIAAYYMVGDILYSMPFNSSTPILYYNKDMFEKAGITQIPDSLPAIAEIGDALLQDGGAGEVISLAIYGWFFEQFTCKQGQDYVNNGNGRQDAATAVAFDSNGAGVKTLSAWKALADAGYAPNVGRGGDAGLADFSSGKAAMTLGSTASLKQILNDVNGKFEVGTAYFPKVSPEDKGGVSIGGGSLWALNNEDPAKEKAVWEFVKFLVSGESQAYWNAQTGYFPVTIAAHEDPVFQENIKEYPQFMTAIDQLHDSSPQSAGALLSVFPEARQIVETEIENMLNSSGIPEDSVAKIAENINRSIEDYNLLNE